MPENLRVKPLERPGYAAFSLMVLVLMVLLFIFGKQTPTKIVPPAVAIIAVTMALLVVHAAKVEPIGNVIKDIDWPVRVIPVFVAMMFSATLGGNATLIGASANVVSTSICASHGKPVSFVTFMRYGVPVTLCQLGMAALYVLGLFYFTGR